MPHLHCGRFQMRAFYVMLIVGAVLGSAPRLRAEPQLVNGIDAVVHDSVVTFSEVEVMTLPAMDVLYRQYRDQAAIFQKKVNDRSEERRVGKESGSGGSSA